MTIIEKLNKSMEVIDMASQAMNNHKIALLVIIHLPVKSIRLIFYNISLCNTS